MTVAYCQLVESAVQAEAWSPEMLKVSDGLQRSKANAVRLVAALKDLLDRGTDPTVLLDTSALREALSRIDADCFPQGMTQVCLFMQGWKPLRVHLSSSGVPPGQK